MESVNQQTIEDLDTPDPGLDDAEFAEWIESLDDAIIRHGPKTTAELLKRLQNRAARQGVVCPPILSTAYVNTIAPDEQPDYPGDRELEDELEALIRWNAMAMVVRANREFPGIGGHLSSYASLATLFEVGFNHYFRAPNDGQLGDLVYLHGHSSPGVYARAYLEGRLTDRDLDRFRRETPRESGLSSYPHPWLMPRFWQFPTVSMGLGPIEAIYQARFLRYLTNRELLDTSDCRVWCFPGDGEMDEPESTAALTLAAREQLDNLIFVVNCNLQRLDGPVRGNHKIIQELEAVFRGAGWNVIKVVWGSGWDRLLTADQGGQLVERMDQIVDGQYQKYCVEPPDYFRENFFGASEELERLGQGYSDEQLDALDRDRGGHDAAKVFAAYRAAVDQTGAPTVILAKTIKGYGLGSAGEAQNVTHKAKKLDEDQLHAFRSRFGLPLTDEGAEDLPFYKPADDSPEMKYLHERRRQLGGYLPVRDPSFGPLEIPALDTFEKLLEEFEGSTTLAFGRLLMDLLKHKRLGPRIVPIIPDEARTFGLESLFGHAGIYTAAGQRYEPVDADKLIRYREAHDGQLLEEGITEAGAMGSFIAAGTSYANLSLPMIPIYLFYSMFGFQRVGDLIWAAADSCSRGFLLGCTAGRTTLNGEGLQHQDGHSQLLASTVPTLRSYDPAYAYETIVIIQEGLRRMYQENQEEFYYITLYNERLSMPAMPKGVTDGILSGLYKVKSVDTDSTECRRPQLFGSGATLCEAERAQKLLADKFGVASDLWSVTSYSELRRNALAAERNNRLHPEEDPQRSYLEKTLEGISGPFIAVTDFMKAVPDQIARWIPGTYHVLGTDGFGRSDTRPALRSHFEVNAEHIAYAALVGLARDSAFDEERLPKARSDLDIDPEKMDPATS